MANSSLNLVDNLAEGTHKIECKYRHNNKKCKKWEIKDKDGECYLEWTNVKNYMLMYKCLCCKNNYQKKFEKDLKKQFPNT